MSRLFFGPVLVLLAIIGSSLAVSDDRNAEAQSGETTYLVVFKNERLPGNFERRIEGAGGTVAIAYPEIGVVTVHTSNTAFEATMEADRKVMGVTFSPTPVDSHGNPAGLEADPEENPSAGDFSGGPVSGSDPLSHLQWDMDQIHVPEAHEITGGSDEVLVGDIDTGLDYTHPDLASNVDFENSVSCIGGVPDQDPTAWADRGGHGTHTAGTIAAEANDIGIVGIAPNVKIAAIKAGNDAGGFFFPADVVCAFMWAGSHDVDVTNNSYFADPWLFNCRDDPEQAVILEAEERAVAWAQEKGVLVVASSGNDNIDLPHKTVDVISPDWPDGAAVTRPVDENCFDVPAELPDVVTVTANGNLMHKAYYSSYGLGVVELTAPGGDRRFQVTTAAVNGRVLSTWPSALFDPADPLGVQDCSVTPCATYEYAQGTSMAAPHVTGVAALIFSLHEDIDPQEVAEILTSTADEVACPPNPFDPGPPFIFLANCEGDEDNNSFFGHGQVNALTALADGDERDEDDSGGDHDQSGRGNGDRRRED